MRPVFSTEDGVMRMGNKIFEWRSIESLAEIRFYKSIEYYTEIIIVRKDTVHTMVMVMAKLNKSNRTEFD